jgi:hypothetical protein
VPHFQLVTTDGDALGAVELSRPDWPDGSSIYRGGEPNLRVVDRIEVDDSEHPFEVPVVQEALARALEEGWIAGAEIDVVRQEPLPPDHPLLRLDNVIVTPHAAFCSETSDRRASEQGGQERGRRPDGHAARDRRQSPRSRAARVPG